MVFSRKASTSIMYEEDFLKKAIIGLPNLKIGEGNVYGYCLLIQEILATPVYASD